MTKKKVDELDGLSSSEEQPQDNQEQDSQEQEEPVEPQQDDYKQLITALNGVAAGITQMLKQQEILNGKIHQMNDNLVAGYKQTAATLQTTLAPLAEAMQKASQQAQQLQQQQQQFPVSNGPTMNMGGGNFDPFNAKNGHNGGGNGQMMQAMGNGQMNPMVMMLLEKLMAPDPSQNMYAMLGQRMFTESIMANMYMNKAAMRKLREKNLLDDEDYMAFNTAQNQMYGPLIGQANAQKLQQQQQSLPNKEGQPNGQQSIDNKTQ